MTVPLMSALGQKRTLSRVGAMSALPPKADIVQHGGNVRFVPKADICGAAKFRLFDHLVRASEQRRWYVEAERFGSLEVVDVTRILTANEGLLCNRD